MASPYVYERQSEYWTSRRVEEFLLDAGFEVVVYPLVQYYEKFIPADFIFFDKKRSKMFGLQYKALYRNDEDFWQIDLVQHHTLMRYSWIYYCFSELKNPADFRSALHYARFVEPVLIHQDRLYRTHGNFPIYSRWGAFFQRLEKCRNGVVVYSDEHLRSILKPENNTELVSKLIETMIDIFLIDFATKHTVHFSSLLSERGTN